MSTVEIVESTQLSTALAKSGLSNPELVEIRDAFQPLYAKAEAIVNASEGIVVADATHVSEMKAARAARLELKAVRVEAEKQRKALKESALRRGQVIDEVGRLIKGFIEPVEDRLLGMEEFAERAEAARKEQLAVERSAEIIRAGGDPQHYRLGDMPQAEFDALLAGLHKARRDAKEAAERAEAERLARIKAEQEERARLQAERDKAEQERQAALAELKRAHEEREKAEAKARAEREAAEVAARKEREAREKVEIELAAKRRAEEKAAAEAEKARKAAERAPDVVKIRSVATMVRRIDLPEVKSDAAKAAMAEVADAQERFAKWIEARAAVLEGGAA